jgi:ABC-2 type transport system permease protein
MPIFDQGYQHWQGRLSSHAWRWWTITRHGVQAQMKNRLARVVMLFAWVPAIGLVLVLVLWGLIENRSDLIMPLIAALNLPPDLLDGAREYRTAVWTIAYQFFFQFELFCAMILVVLVGPNLISQDLRFNALPLYLARPMRRWDYFVGKLGVIAWFLGLVAVVPAVIAYFFGILFSLDPGVLWDTGRLLLACIAYGIVIALSAGTFMLALSSLSRRSMYVGMMWVGIWFVSSTVASVWSMINEEIMVRDVMAREAADAQVRPGGRRPPLGVHAAVEDKLNTARLKVRREDFRPLLSYVGNLERIGHVLLGTDAAWRQMGKLARRGAESDDLVMFGGAQYPWYWSAAVLAGLMGLSVWILSFRVKSLDRLR